MSAFDDSTVLVTVAAVAALVAVNVCEELTWPLPPVVFWSTVFTVAAVFFHALAAVAAWYNDEAGSAVSLGEAVEATRLKLTPAKFCSACCKESDALRVCNGCKGVWYCDEGCQKNHRDEHGEDCKRIKKELDKRGGKLDARSWMWGLWGKGTELDVGPLGKLPPREECPICMLVMPTDERFCRYFPCCGKSMCGGCCYQHEKSRERAAEREQMWVPHACAFCRTAVPESNEAVLARLRKRVEHKDPKALYNMAMCYGFGHLGLSVDQEKCIDLLLQSADLGFPDSQYQLGCYYYDGEMGLERNQEEAIKSWEKAAEGGNLLAQHNLGSAENNTNGNYAAAIHHWQLSASGGFKLAMNGLIDYFEDGLLHHGDLAETLQAFYLARAELRSEDRDEYIEHLKRIGKYMYEPGFWQIEPGEFLEVGCQILIRAGFDFSLLRTTERRHALQRRQRPGNSQINHPSALTASGSSID